MNTDNAYESVLNAKARRNRYNRDIRKRREALARRKLQISSGPILRSLKTAARKALAKERAPSLWILPADIDFRTMHQSHNAQASLLGLPAELRQKILLLSFNIRDIIPHSSQGPREKPRDFRPKKTQLYENRVWTSHEQLIMDRLNDRIAELCQVASIIGEDMRYVGRQWQHAIEHLTQKEISVNALQFPEFIIQPTPMFEHRRKRSRVVRGDDRPLKGKRPGRCWYCTERHDKSGCPRATEDPQKWLRDTKPVRGWRRRKQTKNSFSFQVKKVVFSD